MRLDKEKETYMVSTVVIVHPYHVHHNVCVFPGQDEKMVHTQQQKGFAIVTRHSTLDRALRVFPLLPRK